MAISVENRKFVPTSCVYNNNAHANRFPFLFGKDTYRRSRKID